MANLVINRNVELKAGFEWIKASFFIFRESPLQFIILGIFSSIIGFLPLFGAFMTPIFLVKFATLAKRVEHGEKLRLSDVFDNLFVNKVVVRLAFLNFCLNSIIFIGQYLVDNLLRERGFSTVLGINSGVIFFFIPILVLQLAMWISPVICLNNEDISPGMAMWLSIKAGLYNIPTLLLYSLLMILFTILALLPLGLGLLIWLPVLSITSYYIYKDVFI